jgi:hypothetical protein
MTLIEIVLTLFIMTIALLGLLSAIASVQALDTLTRERSLAINEAMARMEEAMATPYSDLTVSTNGFSFDVFTTADSGQQIKLLPGTGLTVPGLITVTDSTLTSDLVVVEVRVTWLSSVGKDVEIVLRSMVAVH